MKWASMEQSHIREIVFRYFKNDFLKYFSTKQYKQFEEEQHKKFLKNIIGYDFEKDYR